VVAFGDSACLIVVGERVDVGLNARARAIANVLADLPGAEGWHAPVVGHASVLVRYDPARLTEATVTATIQRLLDGAPDGIECSDGGGGTVEISVRYGGPDGPDLEDVAARLGLTTAEVVNLHAEREYRVLVLGFAPGFAYLGPLDPALVMPRRATPRPRVPAGSVAIAGEQTAVYPLETPGGWHLIGRTDEPLWDVRRDPPARVRPGDRVRFVARG
jgi:KipI family sensor histidine kinase inhibitor